MTRFPRSTFMCIALVVCVLICGAAFPANYYVSNMTGSAAEITSGIPERYPLADGDTLTLSVDRGPEQIIQFQAGDFSDIIGGAYVSEVVNVLNTRGTDITASVIGISGQYYARIRSNRTDFDGAIQVTGGTANSKLLFPTDEFVNGDGSQFSPFGSISLALRVASGTASNLANIYVAAGMYYRENVAMKDYVNLRGGYEPLMWTRDTSFNETVIDGDWHAPDISFTNVLGASLDGFTIVIDDSRGGISCSNSSPTIRDNIILGKPEGYGSGISCVANSSSLIENNTIIGHTAALGGGIYCSTSSPTIQNNIINGNSALWNGGGIACSNSSPIIQNNVFSENYGNAIYCSESSSPLIQNNIISDNSGGGIACFNSSPTIMDNVILDSSTLNGAGIRCSGVSSPTIQNNILSGNLGGGIYCADDSTPTIESNVISGNSALGGFGYSGGIWCAENSSPMIQNNVISGNSTGIFCVRGSFPTIRNNTISENGDFNTIIQNGYIKNPGVGIFSLDASPVLLNNIFHANTLYDVFEANATSDPTAHHNEFFGSPQGIWRDEGVTTLSTIAVVNSLYEAKDNVSVPPRFLPAITGVAFSITYDPTTFQSIVRDPPKRFSPGALAGLLINAASTLYRQFPIASNTANTITMWGDFSTMAAPGDGYRVFDYHLGPRSALIDAGTDPGGVSNDIDGDPCPQGAGYDIGADEFVGLPAPAEGEGEVDELLPEEVGDLEFESGEGDSEEESPAEQEPEEAGSPSPTPTSPALSLCPTAGATASTALAAKLDWLREWRDGELLLTQFGETMTIAYYWLNRQ